MSKKPSPVGRYLDFLSKLTFLGCLSLVGILIAFLFLLGTVLYIIFGIPRLPEPLPDYPNDTNLAIHLEKAGELKYSLTHYECGEVFVGENYRAFATTDDYFKIKQFYETKALGNKSVNEVIGYSHSRSSEGINYICFTGYAGKNNPTNVVAIISPTNAEASAVIKEVFPNAPPNSLIVLLVQGYVYYG